MHWVNLRNSKEYVLVSDNRYMVSKIEQMRRVHRLFEAQKQSPKGKAETDP